MHTITLEVIKLNISVTDLLKLPNPNIIDIRTIENFNNNHIPGSKNISAKDLLVSPSNYLNKSEIYYIYCKHGLTSPKLCQILRNQGYNVVNVIGGYEAWLLQS